MLDCVIVGAGPAGLTAAIYAARFRLRVRVVDGGASRAGLIPLTRNQAGFPDGISGVELLSRMNRQAALYEAEATRGVVAGLTIDAGAFQVRGDFGELAARTVLLATGVTSLRPDISDGTHRDALQSGRLRYCPVCDGYEVTDQNVAVIGTGDRGLAETTFLRSYTTRLTLLPHEAPHRLTADQRARLRALGVTVKEHPARILDLAPEGVILSSGDERLAFDAVYPALGSVPHSDLGRGLGAAVTDDGSLRVDAHQRTSVPGLYAAGDVVLGLDQISHAMGEAGVAATTIRNDLAERTSLLRGAPGRL